MERMLRRLIQPALTRMRRHDSIVAFNLEESS